MAGRQTWRSPSALYASIEFGLCLIFGFSDVNLELFNFLLLVTHEHKSRRAIRGRINKYIELIVADDAIKG
jgi:hypothetical protein